ncbi:hypothetical protein N6H18_16810 [Reichenbachiella agarivorans]|uniref:Uncharacterized protein n=1 Tax=Reichenbachiella agarivorans TaxID=2979464 RepID=A0ABY6CNA8_9BACT|nr:hypothetical protein [Reichenbachiella agarivorans]UXP32006.1 hypothetical protein N6H18_16810 [Reichenbachiella agarivorans]
MMNTTDSNLPKANSDQKEELTPRPQLKNVAFHLIKITLAVLTGVGFGYFILFQFGMIQ